MFKTSWATHICDDNKRNAEYEKGASDIKSLKTYLPSNNSCDNFFNLILKWHHIKERLTHNPHRRLFLFFLIYRASEWAYKTFVIKFIASFLLLIQHHPAHSNS